jgi:hypothetical protein
LCIDPLPPVLLKLMETQALVTLGVVEGDGVAPFREFINADCMSPRTIPRPGRPREFGVVQKEKELPSFVVS